mgnify:FL=1
MHTQWNWSYIGCKGRHDGEVCAHGAHEALRKMLDSETPGGACLGDVLQLSEDIFSQLPEGLTTPCEVTGPWTLIRLSPSVSTNQNSMMPA